mgnify:CR=1 FL=1
MGVFFYLRRGAFKLEKYIQSINAISIQRKILIMNKDKLKKCMMSVLEPIGVLTFNEWWTKTFTKYPELDTAEYGNYFRNAQQELKRDNKVYLNQSKQWIVV